MFDKVFNMSLHMFTTKNTDCQRPKGHIKQTPIADQPCYFISTSMLIWETHLKQRITRTMFLKPINRITVIVENNGKVTFISIGLSAINQSAIYLFIHRSIHPSIVHPSMYLSVILSIYRSTIYLSIISIYLSTLLSVCLSVSVCSSCLPIYLFIYLFIWLSI